MALVPVINDQFNRANTSAGAAGSTTGVGNGWIDVTGGVWHINNDQLQPVTTTSSFGYGGALLVRPTSEAVSAGQVIGTMTYVNSSPNGIVVAKAANGDYYMLFTNPGAGPPAAMLYAVVGGNPTQLGASCSYAITSGHNVQLVLNVSTSANGSRGLVATVIDATTGSTVGTINASDSSSTLQGSLVFGVSMNGSTATVAFSQVQTFINEITVLPVTDPNIFWAPGAWRFNGSTWAQSQQIGAYFKLGFSGTSIAISIDSTPYAASSGNFPAVMWSIDGGPWSAAVTNPPGTISNNCASGLAAGTHTLEFMINSTANDTWVYPVNVVRVTGIALDYGATLSPYPNLRPNRTLHYGDSIGCGTRVYVDSAQGPISDPRYAPCFILAEALNSEPTNISFGSQGWVTPGAGNEPGFASSWSLFDQNTSRLVNGLFPTSYSDIIIEQGQNDYGTSASASSVQSAVTTTLAAIRAAAPNARIWVVIPISGGCRAPIDAGVTAYLTSSGDHNCYLIDRGTSAQTGLTGLAPGSSTEQSYDGVHPLAMYLGRLEADVAHRMAAALQVPTETGSFGGFFF